MTDPRDEKPRPFEIQHDLQKEAGRLQNEEDAATPSSTPKTTPRSERAKPSRRRKTKPAPAPRGTPEPTGLPRALPPGALVLAGAVLMAITWIAYQNPYLGVNDHQQIRIWPWEAFRAHTSAGGPLIFHWHPVSIISVGGALLTLLLVIGSILRSSPARGAFLFVLAGAAAIIFAKDVALLGDSTAMALHAVAALTAGAILLRDGALAGRGRRSLLLAGLLILAGVLFFPRGGLGAYASYDPIALAFLEPFRVLAHLPGQSLVTPDMLLGLDRLWSVDGLHAIGIGLLVVLGVVTLLGIRGRWSSYVGGLLVLLTALAPLLAHHWANAPLAEAGQTDLLSLAGSPHWTLLFGLALILLAGILSLLGLGGRWTVGVAGVGLGVITLLVASRHYVGGLTAIPNAEPLWAGLAGAAVWLGPGMGALLLPLAAGVMDQGESD